MKQLIDNDKYVGDNGLQLITYATCWRCGKPIAINHHNELIEGVHKQCSTRYALDLGGKIEIMFAGKEK